jgi:hypothetical protein
MNATPIKPGKSGFYGVRASGGAASRNFPRKRSRGLALHSKITKKSRHASENHL